MKEGRGGRSLPLVRPVPVPVRVCVWGVEETWLTWRSEEARCVRGVPLWLEGWEERECEGELSSPPLFRLLGSSARRMAETLWAWEPLPLEGIEDASSRLKLSRNWEERLEVAFSRSGVSISIERRSSRT